MGNEAVDQTDFVILAFIPTSCSVHLTQDPDSPSSSSISMHLRLSDGDNVRTPDKRSLNNIEWSISIYEGPVSNEHVKSLGAIGLLNYYPASDDLGDRIDEGCSVWTHLEKEPFALLSTFVQLGRVPSRVLVFAQGGIQYSWEPDGSGKIWDVQTKETCSVQRLEISLDIVEKSEEEGSATEGHRPVTADDLQKLERSFASAPSNSLKQINRRLGWILLVAALAAAITIFR